MILAEEVVFNFSTILGILNSIVAVVLCPIIASKKNRSVGGWIVGGLFLGLIGLIIVACLKPKQN